MREKLLQKCNDRFKASIIAVEEFRGETTIVVKKQDIVAFCQFLRDDELTFDQVRDVCGAESTINQNGERFEVIYNLYSLKNNFRLRLKVRVEGNDPHVPTVTGVWPAANWPEREAYDMFGIVFDGHPDLRRMYLPEEFEHHPLRKDFPLMGIPGSLPLPRK